MIVVVYKNEKQNLKCKIAKNVFSISGILLYFQYKVYKVNSSYSNFVTRLILTLNKKAIKRIFKDGEKYNHKVMGIGVYKGSVYFEYKSLDKEFYTHGIIDKKGKIIPITIDNSKKTNDLKKLFSFCDKSCVESNLDLLLKANINWHANYDNNKLPINVINPQCPPNRTSQRTEDYKPSSVEEV